MGGRLLELSASCRALVEHEIGRIVTDAQQAGSILDVGPIGSKLARDFAPAGFSADQIANHLAMVASRAGIAVELRRSR